MLRNHKLRQIDGDRWQCERNEMCHASRFKTKAEKQP
ncbi:hypothetical protein T4A_4352 [Trichinella pseudospiralis]|uniref:Uncharacterized protein n=1 Tax=Trichinella pseudospiralis TaxID=6337 RepID=A0A0V1DVI1_TRIPS|nr:hypothetical protein T4A_1479 [Trichinella pseudospiralis]KRY65090.1 hypothetical protein T4A_4352 [Trichinella pseudospiralis]KRY84478.1 hypothetical protein T4D_12615 [Trichinella pseudospiralis]